MWMFGVFFCLAFTHSALGLQCWSCSNKEKCKAAKIVECNADAVENEARNYRSVFKDIDEIEHTDTKFKCYAFNLMIIEKNREIELHGCTYANENPCLWETHDETEMSNCRFCTTDLCENPVCDPNESDDCSGQDYYAIFDDFEDYDGGIIIESHSPMNSSANLPTFEILLFSISWLS